MAEFEDKMVLRTVYLPFDLDQELKSIAFRDDLSKNALIRELVKMGIQAAKEKNDKRFRTVQRIGGPVATEKLKPRVLSKGQFAKVKAGVVAAAKAGAAAKAPAKRARGGRKAAAA